MPHSFLAPTIISAEHETLDFDSGSDPIDTWLRRRAWKNQQSSVSRTYVVATTAHPMQILGFYSLHAGSVEVEKVTAAFRRNSPNPIPILVLGRLAVDRRCQGSGLGRSLLKDAVRRANLAGRIVGAKGILIQAKEHQAANFYVKYGFKALPSDPLKLLLPMEP